MSAQASPVFSSLRQRIGGVLLRDERRLRRKLDQARSQRDHARQQSMLEALERDLAKAEQRITRRREQEPRIEFPEELPVSARHAEIAETIEQNQVVIVAGETGSGKTTQLPKILLSLGRGIRGRIGHTQPRRIAARTVAERISEECGVELGTSVGYTVRFHDQTSDQTLVKVMTDGILLAEIRNDPQLRQYDTIIIDEAHERSLSIDFLLGYLKRLLPRRPDLKLIITSATIDPDRFAELFEGAPIVEVSGRTYPVEVRYRPVAEREDGDTLQAISDAADELAGAGRGDVLVFLSGEREIRDTADLLNARHLKGTEVLPLYGRLSSAEQHRVFEPHSGRRIVLATNVAETSLTVPGIKYVIDPGTARISRYSQRLKVQRLPIEAVSQASANQRAGRCGRTSDGICIRLYSEEDFEGRPEYTDPEILRTNLASVILQMTALDLGTVAEFPFLDPPDRRAVRDGVDLLLELGALEHDDAEGKQRLTPTGRTLSGLPLDPRLARMLVEASRNGCLRDVLIIVSGLSIQDPRERPSDQQQAADTKHARFVDRDSDFASYLNLWRYLREQRRDRSGSAFRRMCRDEFLHFMRIREWQDVHGLLRQTAQELGLELGGSGDSVDSDRIHQSLLAGLLSHIGLNDDGGREYVGARQARFAIFPGSGLAKKPPRWIMAGELVETSRLWARTVARVDPAWIEEQAAHLVKRHYSEPHWSKKRGAVMARERVTLYGVPLVADRLVSYGRIDPEVARELFIRHALVEGDWDSRHEFFHRNRDLLADVEGLEDRVRRRDIRVDDEELFDFYDARVGAEVVSGRHFDTWWKRTRRDRPDLLDFDLDLLVREGAAPTATEAYPQEWRSGEFELALSYAFEPGSERDGITIDVPLGGLSQLEPSAFLWHVPGHRHELVTALIKTLPKTWRKHFAPAGEFARRVLEQVDEGSGALVPTVADELRRLTGVVVPEDAFGPGNVPDHLRLTFRVVDGDREVAVGKDLEALREQLRPQTRTVLSKASHGIERRGATTWEFGDIPREVTSTVHGHTVTAYPTLADRGASVDLTVVESAGQQQVDMAAGLRRLLVLTVTSPVSPLLSAVPNPDKLMLATSPYDSVLSLVEDCVAAGVDHLMHGEMVWRVADFEILREKVRADLYGAAEEAVNRVVQALRASGDLRQQMRTAPPALSDVVDDVAVQLSWLVYPGFVSEAGLEQLVHYPRYLKAAGQRLSPAHDQTADARNMALAKDLEARYYALIESMPDYRTAMPDVRALRWSLEELRVGLFAQRLRTARPVSVKRVTKQLDELERAARA